MKHPRLIVALILLLAFFLGNLATRPAVLAFDGAPMPQPIPARHEVNGFRVTTGQPTIYTATVWMFGNSTLAGSWVADDETIASRLQTLLPAMRIENRATPGDTVGLEYEQLQRTPVNPGDVVLFYDGIVEPQQIEVEAGDSNRIYVCGWLDSWGADLINQIPTINALCVWSQDFTRWYADPIWMNPRVERVVAVRNRAIDQARRWASARGAAFVHVVQPELCTTPLRAWEVTASRRVHNLCALHARIWPQLQKGSDLDLTHGLDDARRTGDVWYLDARHINAEGNALIARAIYDYLVRVF